MFSLCSNRPQAIYTAGSCARVAYFAAAISAKQCELQESKVEVIVEQESNSSTDDAGASKVCLC